LALLSVGFEALADFEDVLRLDDLLGMDFREGFLLLPAVRAMGSFPVTVSTISYDGADQAIAGSGASMIWHDLD
jgi:hypothetical protein